MRRHQGFRLAFLAATLLLASCAPSEGRGSGFCAPPAIGSPFSSDPPPAGASSDESMAALLGLRVALTGAARGETTKVDVLARIQEAQLLIAGTRAELDCAAESARQVADYLARKQSSTVQSLTIGSIAAAAVASIVGVFLSTRQTSSSTQDGAALAGGVLSGGLGLGSLYVHANAQYPHPRNLLADVWFGPKASATYPPIVWGYFTEPVFSNDQRDTIRERILERWNRFEDIRKNDPATVALLFGPGGTYNAATLRLRATMLDEVKAEVELMNQDIAALAARLFRAY
jgi:hypothetical protein